MREREPVAYLMVSRRNETLYADVTSNPIPRVAQHRAETLGGFTAKQGVRTLVWFEQIKKWRRAWKLDLIERGNPEWSDLAIDFGFEPLC